MSNKRRSSARLYKSFYKIENVKKNQPKAENYLPKYNLKNSMVDKFPIYSNWLIYLLSLLFNFLKTISCKIKCDTKQKIKTHIN